MAYLVSELITDAWFLSGIVSADLEMPSGKQATQGLRLLNQLLADKSMDGRLIPYYSQETIDTETVQESYFVPNLINAEEVTYVLNNIRFGMIPLTRRPYFGTGRVNNISSLPGYYHVERAKGGTNIYLYYLPNQAYPLTITGKFSLSKVAQTDDLESLLDDFYINYLEYALAERMCNSYNQTFKPNNAQTLANYEKNLLDISPIDLSITKMSTLSNDNSINWAVANLGNGWTA